MFRSSYITWFYKHNEKYSDREKLSIQMRHGYETASRNYNKIINNIDETKEEIENKIIEENNKLIEEINILKKENNELKIENNELKNTKLLRGLIII